MASSPERDEVGLVQGGLVSGAVGDSGGAEFKSEGANPRSDQRGLDCGNKRHAKAKAKTSESPDAGESRDCAKGVRWLCEVRPGREQQDTKICPRPGQV